MTVALKAMTSTHVYHIETDGRTKDEIQRKVKRLRRHFGIGKQQLKWRFMWKVGEEETDEE